MDTKCGIVIFIGTLLFDFFVVVVACGPVDLYIL